jgi:hypothetical protein
MLSGSLVRKREGQGKGRRDKERRNEEGRERIRRKGKRGTLFNALSFSLIVVSRQGGYLFNTPGSTYPS